MKIALIGATGNAGTRILKEALNRGHEVIAVARSVDSLEARAGLTAVKADLSDPDGLADAIRGADAAVLSVRFQGLDLDTALDGIRRSGVPRLLVVGGAASLEVAPGQVLLDQPGFPDFIKPEATPARAALDQLRRETELDWTFLSPSTMFGPGERTGTFRTGKDQLLTAEDGNSSISYEDAAVALVDEIETPQHSRSRFTVGY